LPEAGGVLDQDPDVMEAFAVIAGVIAEEEREAAEEEKRRRRDGGGA
jgi:hypothetical protein